MNDQDGHLRDRVGNITQLLPGDKLYVPWNTRTGSGIVTIEREGRPLSFFPPECNGVFFTEPKGAKLLGQAFLAISGLSTLLCEALHEGWVFHVGPPTVQ